MKARTDGESLSASNYLTYEEQVRIVTECAIYTPQHKIIEIMKLEYDRKVSFANINYYMYSAAWQSLRNKARDEFEAKIMDEPLFSKRIRIKELAKAYYRLEPNNETLMDAVRILGQLREECQEKSSNGMTFTQYNQYNGLSDEDLRKVIDENTRFLEVIEKKKSLEGPKDAVNQ